ncbi:cytochrome c-type biogenesis protein CcmH [Martelella alba]|uniref:Cytochrome c-type biogenesis protein n=1 Tax=Martelella alba TaxID=2590451 RepID=A0A506U6F7_9HYPH|nr:cytochrome c-type biogenesis protein [Martelella alba]TPW29430.1 cytochrome c-type biogenesis protein CcmH [Martelella alba]
MRFVLVLLFLVLGIGWPLAAVAVNPDEMLSDPALERRARAISEGLRCMVCQNQTIDDSNADLARDLRVLVRQRLVDGDSDKQVVDYIVSRYGDFVLLKPRLTSETVLLWGAPLLLLVAGIGFIVFRRRRLVDEMNPLSVAEEAELSRILEQN